MTMGTMLLNALDDFKNRDNIQSATKDLRRHVATHPKSLYLWYNGMPIYIYAMLINFDCLKAVHEAYLSVRHEISDLPPPCDLPNNIGDCAIHIAVLNNLKKSVMFLVEDVGVNINVRDKDGNTPMHLACIFNRQTIIRYLAYQPSINLNIVNLSLQSPLLIVAIKKNKEFTRLFLLKGAKISFYVGRFVVSIMNTLSTYKMTDMIDYINKYYRQVKNIQKNKMNAAKSNNAFKTNYARYQLICRRNPEPLTDAQLIAQSIGVKYTDSDNFENVCDKIGNHLVAKKLVKDNV